VQAKRNTEALEIAPGTLISGRIVEYKPAAPQPFDTVKDNIKLQLARSAASERAQQVGREKLALLAQGRERETGVEFDKPVTLARSQPQAGVSPDALKAIFQADEHKLPAYTGATNERGGFSIYKVEKVIDAPAPDAAKLAQASSRVGSEIGRELMNAYLASLKADTEVKINSAALEKKQ
jgi:peptidyl-prolyl cis-trans isomerase D